LKKFQFSPLLGTSFLFVKEVNKETILNNVSYFLLTDKLDEFFMVIKDIVNSKKGKKYAKQ